MQFLGTIILGQNPILYFHWVLLLLKDTYQVLSPSFPPAAHQPKKLLQRAEKTSGVGFCLFGFMPCMAIVGVEGEKGDTSLDFDLNVGWKVMLAISK